MSFLGPLISRTVRRPDLISGLSNSFRTLSIAASLQQRRPALDVTATQLKPKSTDRVLQTTADERSKSQEVFNQINQQLAAGEEGRLFAVVQLCGKQFKVTPGDIILVEGYWPPTAGDELRLEKVLLAGAKDFTLIGRPILDAGLVNVKATVIEKTITHTRTHFKKKRRKQYLRINFQRFPNTMLRINAIEIGKKIDSSPDNISDVRLF